MKLALYLTSFLLMLTLSDSEASVKSSRILNNLASSSSNYLTNQTLDHCLGGEPLPLESLNHVSLVVRSVETSVRFYKDVLGFCLIERPSSIDVPGAWLCKYGIGGHLLENESIDEYDTMNKPRPIIPKDNHIAFQCSDVGLAKTRLKEWGIKYVTAVVEEGGIRVDQVFFHDPDGYMIEICNCNNLPISSCPFKPKHGIEKVIKE
ncbi:hypothetical protein ACSBR2_008755 [Camellia fascicularis]